MERSGGKANERQTEAPASESIDAGEVRLAWGNPASWKARWRDESLRRHLDRPLGERLRSALSLVLQRKSPYDRECLSRAIPVEVAGVAARVVTAEDLLIHKMIKLRHDRRRMLQDLADVRAVVDARGAELDWEYIRRWARPDESAWLEEVGRSTDEELVRRLPGG